MGFRDDFVWGAATASYQVEGAAFEDGKGKSIWDVFSHDGGNVYEDDNGDIACDQYHRYPEDVQVMKKLGIKAYRFSISWPRILPEGTGKINEKGLDYYDRLVNELLANDIEPYITLYHWDLPYALHQRGGWLNPDCKEWFYDYAKIIAEHFGDRVKKYITLNEPQCIVGLGYMRGIHAPGYKVGPTDFFRIWYNVLLSHGRGVQAIREAVPDAKVGIVCCGAVYSPETESPEDIEVARYATFHMPEATLEGCNWDVALTTDPLYKGEFPEDVRSAFGAYLPEITEEDRKVLMAPVDFHGQNIYNSVTVRVGADGKPERVKRHQGFPKTAIQWPVTPECLRWAPKFLNQQYNLPIYITENGMSSHDWVSLDGQVHDYARVDFTKRYLAGLKKAADEGCDIRGYFAWSLLDNFEWHSGYYERFGIVYVDYETQERIIKDSAYVYADIIQNNGADL